MHTALEDDSNFGSGAQFWYGNGNPYEHFTTNSGQLRPSPCYGDMDDIPAPLVGLTDAWNQGSYEWWIVLQYKPETDLNINIMDCVLKHNEFDIETAAEQTGRFRESFGQLMFLQGSNPMISVEAYPGPLATAGFSGPMTLDARTLPGLTTVALDGVLYTSKALFPEGIVVALPETGNTNSSGDMQYNLKDGDIIHVKVNMPGRANTADIYYGPDSVMIKYVGVIGTEDYASDPLPL
jgi:hypothetical protein